MFTNIDGTVIEWRDQSGKNNHATQTNAAYQPRLVHNALNAQPVLQFGRGTNFLEIPHSPTLSLTNDFTIFAAVRPDDFRQFNGIISKASGEYPAPLDLYIQLNTGLPQFYFGSGRRYAALSGQSRLTPGKSSLLSFAVSGTNAMTWMDGAYNGGVEITVPRTDFGGPVRIGSRDNMVTRLHGDLAEIIVFDRSLTDDERNDLHDYLGWKYGINVVLDVQASPAAIQRLEGQTATFSVKIVATPHPIVSYQWQKNGVDIPAATNAAYATPVLSLADNESIYRVRIATPATNHYSNPTTLIVLPDTEPFTVNTPAFLLRDQTKSLKTAEEGKILSPFKSRLWQPAEEAARNTVKAIVQTMDGFLWVGTDGGLARFDGVQFEFFPMTSNGSTADERINTLSVDKAGTLFVGTGGKGLFQFENGNWSRHILSSNLDGIILTTGSTRDGSLWIGTRVGMGLVDSKGRFFTLGNRQSGDRPYRELAAKSVRSVVDNDDGTFWVGAGDDLILMRDRLPVTNYLFQQFRSDFIRSVCTTRDGAVWAGANSGVIRFKNGQYTHYSKTNGLPDNTITSIYEDRHGNLWIGTFGGLCRFADGKFVPELTAEGDPFDQIFCFFEDREGNLWIGAKNGLYQFRVQQFTTYTTRHGLAHNNVISVYEDDDGALWIGTWGGGLHCLRSGKITIYSNSKNQAMRNDLVLAINGSRKGGIWFGEDYDGGFYRLKDGDFQHWGQKHGLVRNAVRALLEDISGRLWVGTASAGLGILEPGKNLLFRKDLPSFAVRCLLQTRDERIWIGTETGLCCWKEDAVTTLTTNDGLAHDTILALYEDNKTSLWIGTAKGLSKIVNGGVRVSNEDSAVQRRIVIHSYPLPNEPVLEILEDDFENLWLATRRGVLRVSKKDLEASRIDSNHEVTFTHFGKADGMASEVCVGVAKPSAFKSKDGRLWFATTKGLAVTDPKLKIEKNEKAPPVMVRSVIANKRHISDFKGNHIPPGRGELEFNYTALSYTEPEKNRFKYKLEGFDQDWIDAGNRRTAYYNNTPPGNYTFRVVACNSDGIWNETGATINLTLQPHFWQTWWLKSLLAIACVSVVATGARYATKRRLQWKLERLEQQHAVEKERLRISQDIHDDVGSRLTEILLLTDLTQKNAASAQQVNNHVGTIANVTREIVSHLDAIVWTVSPENDFLDRSASYIYEQVETYFSMTSIRCRWDIPEELPHWPLSSDVRHNIFMVIRETLNNIVKHSAASEVRFCLKLQGNLLSITISDNGKGFAIETISSTGNGLLSMKNRMTSIGGKFTLRSSPGKGSEVQVEIALKP